MRNFQKLDFKQNQDSPMEDKDSFYNNLTQLLATVPRKDYILIGGDMNAKLGERLMEERGHIGQFTVGSRNENEEQLANFTVMNVL